MIIPGRQAIGWILTFTIGLVGAFVGGFRAKGMHLSEWWQTLVVKVIVAAVLVLLVSSLVRSSVTKRHLRT